MSIDDNPHLPFKRTFSKAGLFPLGRGEVTHRIWLKYRNDRIRDQESLNETHIKEISPWA